MDACLRSLRMQNLHLRGAPLSSCDEGHSRSDAVEVGVVVYPGVGKVWEKKKKNWRPIIERFCCPFKTKCTPLIVTAGPEHSGEGNGGGVSSHLDSCCSCDVEIFFQPSVMLGDVLQNNPQRFDTLQFFGLGWRLLRRRLTFSSIAAKVRLFARDRETVTKKEAKTCRSQTNC